MKKDRNFQMREIVSKEKQLQAVKKDGSFIQYIENPSEKVIYTAIDNGAKKEDLIKSKNINWNKMSYALWLKIQCIK